MRHGFLLIALLGAATLGGCTEGVLDPKGPIAIAERQSATLPNDRRRRFDLMLGVAKLSLLNAPFFLGLITGGAMIYWFTGASTQAVTTGAYRAVEFIKANIKLEGVEKASIADSKKVVEICTQYAQKGMFNIFLAVFFATLAFAFLEPYFFIGYLISIALFGLYQAVFMANAGGAWDNAKKVVEVDLKEKGTPLHAAVVVGDTVGDPFKDTSGPAINPMIKVANIVAILIIPLIT